MLLISCILVLAAQVPLSPSIPPTILPPPPAPSKVLATVDGMAVKASDIEPLLWDNYGKPIEDDYIEYLEVADAARKANLTLTDQETQTGFQQFLDEIKTSLKPGQTVEGALEEKGFSEGRIYLRVKMLLLLTKIQLQSFHPAEWVKVSTLIFPTPGNQAEQVSAEAKKAMDAYARLEKGGNWDQILRQETTAASVLQSNGSIGWHPLSAFPGQIQVQLKNLKAGQYTKPAQTPNGIQIFKLDEQGAEATGLELKEMQNRFISSTRGQTEQEIRAHSKVVRMP